MDADGDGTPDVKDAGAAYVFERQGGVWREIVRLQHPRARTADVFGGSLGGVSITETHVLVGTFVNSKGFNGRPRLPRTHAGSAVVYAVPR